MSMSTGAHPATSAPPAGPLHEAHAAAAAGRYQDALVLAERARSEHPANIHVLAYLKQLERLGLVGVRPVRPPVAIEDVLRSLEAIARNAQEGTAAGPSPAERRAAIERLKERYFVEAGLHRSRGDHARALEEIRRVLILDPGDVRARGYETGLLTRAPEQPPVRTAREESPRTLESFLVRESPHPPARFVPTDASAAPAEEPVLPVSRTARHRRRRTNPVLPLLIATAALSLIVLLLLPRKAQGPAATGVLVPEGVPTEQQLPPYGSDTPEIRLPLETREAVKPPPSDAPSSPSAPPPRGATPSRTRELPVKPATTIPRLLVLSPPILPPSLADARGTVQIRVQVAPDGRPLQARVAESTNTALNTAVIDAILNSQFEPARTASGPITAWVTIPISFGTRTGR